MLVFFDTEFSDLCRDAKLISVGFISEDGQEFYAELSGTYRPEDCSAFTQESVLPHLQGGDVRITMDALARQLADWIRRLAQPITLATDSLSWDWPWILVLLGDPGAWPENLAVRPALMHELVDSPFLDQAVQRAFENQVPRLRQHHALDDAKANRLAWLEGAAGRG